MTTTIKKTKIEELKKIAFSKIEQRLARQKKDPSTIFLCTHDIIKKSDTILVAEKQAIKMMNNINEFQKKNSMIKFIKYLESFNINYRV